MSFDAKNWQAEAVEEQLEQPAMLGLTEQSHNHPLRLLLSTTRLRCRAVKEVLMLRDSCFQVTAQAASCD